MTFDILLIMSALNGYVEIDKTTRTEVLTVMSISINCMRENKTRMQYDVKEQMNKCYEDVHIFIMLIIIFELHACFLELNTCYT